MADLHIPDAAFRALAEYTEDIGGAWSGTAEEDVRAFAAPVVAAKLREIAARPDMHLSAHLLRAEADELDPPQSGGAPA